MKETKMHHISNRFTRLRWTTLGLLLLVVVTVMVMLLLGEARLDLATVFTIIKAKILGQQASLDLMPQGMIAIVWDIRLPRILTGVLVGAGLAVSGAIFQALLMNPLADPYTIGISTGAALGASIAIFLTAILQVAAVPILPAAFIGAIGTLFLVIRIAGQSRTLSSSSLIIAGIIVSSVASAMISLLKSLSGDEVSIIVFWLMGSLASRTWQHVAVMATTLIVCLFLCMMYSTELNILSLGEEGALTVGVDVKRVRLILLITASMLTAACVSVSGIIGFVGLVIPHILRQFMTNDHRFLVPLSAIVGGLLLVVADNLTRVFMVVEIPVGVLTTLLGGPFFIYLFTRNNTKLIG